MRNVKSNVLLPGQKWRHAKIKMAEFLLKNIDLDVASKKIS